MRSLIFVATFCLFFFHCGDDEVHNSGSATGSGSGAATSGETGGDTSGETGGDTNGDIDVGDGLGGDNGFGGFGGACEAGNSQCNDCIDNDGDGQIDGFDTECTGPADNDEGSFATGIPGDNVDAIKQDCFFDGNSGGGNDGCDIHVCCILDLSAFGGVCPDAYAPNRYDPAECTQSDKCKEECGIITPPGCDCFGCCTICEGDDCVDVITNPAVAPNCTAANASDSDACPVCVKNTDCNGGGCEGVCELCPGQTGADLPASCSGTLECPGGLTTCQDGTGCADGQFCSNGCCVGIIE